MKIKLVSALSVVALSLTGVSSAAVSIFSDDFEDGNSTGWSSGAYSSPNNASAPTRTTSIDNSFDGSFGYKLSTVMFDETGNNEYAGTQVNSPTIAAGSFTGYALSDITMGFKFAVTADAGPASTIRFELRESSGDNRVTTHSFGVPVAGIAGELNNYSFTLDNNQTGAFGTSRSGAFDPTRTYSIYVQVQDGWAITGSTRNIDLTMDNFSVTAVPEPSAALLGLISTGLLAARRRR